MRITVPGDVFVSAGSYDRHFTNTALMLHKVYGIVGGN